MRVEFGFHTVGRGRGDPATEPYPSHALLLEDAQRAEQLGFDAVWVPDHFYFDRPYGLETFPEAWTLLTAIGVTTERVRLGTNVLAAGFRHPALLAKMAGALQELCSGRLILGMGAGNQPIEHNAFGIDFERRIGRFKEYLTILDGLLKGETVSLEGRHYTLREASLRTAVPKVPIWVAAGGEQMFGLTAQYGAGWNAAGVGGNPETFQQKYSALGRACAAVGRNVKNLEVTMMVFVGVAPDAAAARELTEALAEQQRTTPDGLRGRMVVGTPDEIAARVRPFVELGLTHVIWAVQAPRPEEYQERTELLVREVFPRVRG